MSIAQPWVSAFVTLSKDKVKIHFQVTGKQITRTKDNRLIVDDVYITLFEGYDVNIQYTAMGIGT